MSIDHSTSSIEPLLNYFDRLIPLNKEERELVKTNFQQRLFRKRHYVLQEGTVCTQFYFVVRGCLRMYKIDEKGNTHILQFAAAFLEIYPHLVNRLSQVQIASFLGITPEFLSRLRNRISKQSNQDS